MFVSLFPPRAEWLMWQLRITSLAPHESPVRTRGFEAQFLEIADCSHIWPVSPSGKTLVFQASSCPRGGPAVGDEV